jgi:ribosomal protein S18 acetylase RimI-like enzyme
MIYIRQAIETDIDAIYSFDLIAKFENERRESIKNEVLSGNCLVAVEEKIAIGYGVLDYSFYQNGFIEMLYVDSEHRRKGVGKELLKHLELSCKTSKLFTSTNLSNLPMQALLTKSNYILSGIIHNLDEGDPEIIYYKLLKNK